MRSYRKKCKHRILVVGYEHGTSDFCTSHIAESLTGPEQEVKLLQRSSKKVHDFGKLEDVDVHEISSEIMFDGRLGNLQRSLMFRRSLNLLIDEFKPHSVICIYLIAFGMLSQKTIKKIPFLSVFFPDIPVPGSGGLLGKWWNSRAWRHLSQAHLVWASDRFKAKLAQDTGKLLDLPKVSHNCVKSGYFKEQFSKERDPWLRNELRRKGATIGAAGGSILLRAGAIGEGCGIEETLSRMELLPQDYVFVMMGRPTMQFKAKLRKEIKNLCLDNRVFLWELPSDRIWKKILLGSDIGHLIHRPTSDPYQRTQFELNSSLSNCRLFQYMAASLPIISYDDSRLNQLHQEVQCFRVARLQFLADDIASHWMELGKVPKTRIQLGFAGRSAHLSKYNWDSQFRNIKTTIIEKNKYEFR